MPKWLWRKILWRMGPLCVAIDRINRLPQAPTFLLHTGDLTHLAKPEEFDTAPMLRLALDLKMRLLCPRVLRSERRLALFTIGDLPRDFTRGTLGIPEPRADLVEVAPVEVDWALVPGLGYDPRCYRIGRGAGHYDWLLPKLRSGVPRWSGCATLLGLNSAEASNEYSFRK